MSTKIGVVGPADSVEKVLVVGRDLKDIELQPIVYGDMSEITTLLPPFLTQCDSLVFTGPWCHACACDIFDIKIPTFHIPRDGVGLYRTLFSLSYHEGVDVSRLSFDTISDQALQETYQELRLNYETTSNMGVSLPLDTEAALKQHLDLWESGRITGVVTCLLRVHRELKRLGVPVYRIPPTMSTIRQVLVDAQLKSESRRIQGMQIGIILVSLDDSELSGGLVYQDQRLKIRLHEIMVDYGEISGAAVFHMGGSEFTVVTTRGSLEQTTAGYTREPFFFDSCHDLELRVSAGIGLGDTAMQAESRARIALSEARQAGGGCAFAATDQSIVIGPLSKGEMSSTRHEDIVRRLLSHCNDRGLARVTSGDAAEALQLSERSARRVLSDLALRGYAQAMILDTNSKGRPRKIYRIMVRGEDNHAGY